MERIGDILTQSSIRAATTKQAFRFSCSATGLERVLECAYRTIVAGNDGTPDMTPEIRYALRKVAEALTQRNDMRKNGIILMGNVGTGKTTMARAIVMTVDWGVAKGIAAREFARNTALDAFDIAEIQTDTARWRDFIREPLIAIDDFGKEPVAVMRYGNASSPMVELLERRYSLRKSTILTTNLTPQEISEKYGKRIADRLRECMAVIPFTSETSFR